VPSELLPVACFQKLLLDRKRIEPAQNDAAISTMNVRAGEDMRLTAQGSGMAGSSKARP